MSGIELSEQAVAKEGLRRRPAATAPGSEDERGVKGRFVLVWWSRRIAEVRQ